MLLSAMADELVKIAVRMGQLGAIYRRLPIIRVKGNPRSIPMSMSGDMRQIGLGGGLAGFSPATSQNARRLLPKVDVLAAKMTPPGVSEEIAATIRENVKQHLSSSASVGRMPGKIVRPSGGGVRTIRSSGKHVIPASVLKGLSPEAQKGINQVTGLHESYETGVRKLAPFGSHLNPEVLAKEHNLVTSLTGKGAQETRNTMNKIRDAVFEREGFDGHMASTFGPRASEYAFGSGKKIPKAMRKRLRDAAAEQHAEGVAQLLR